jgi:hypothetical protein
MNRVRNKGKQYKNKTKKVLLNKIRLRMTWNMNTMKKNIILKMIINEI